MNILNITLLSLALGSLSAAAFAQDKPSNTSKDSGVYGALGVTTYDFDNYGADVKLGYNLNKYLGVEAQGTLGLTDDSQEVCSDTACAKLTDKTEYTIGAYAVGRIPLSDQFEVFARAGIHETKFNTKISDPLRTDFDTVTTGFAGGGGIQYALDSQNAIRAEYTSLDYQDEGWSGTATIAYVRKF